MNGAEVLATTALASGIGVCFANPGTTELPIVEAFDAVPGMRSVLCLFEGVCTGAADGFGRMTGGPAMTLLHLGAGLSYGVSNIHNARNARTPMVVVVGDHRSGHRASAQPFNIDLDSLAALFSGWHRCVASPADVAGHLVAAIEAAKGGRQPVVLAFPHDHQEADSGNPSIALPTVRREAPDPEAILRAADLFRRHERVAVLLGGSTLHETGLRQAIRLQAATGCSLFAESFPGRLDRGVGLPALERFPFGPEEAATIAAAHQAFVLVDAPRPVAFFGKQGAASELLPQHLPAAAVGGSAQDGREVLQALADLLGAPEQPPPVNTELRRPELPTGALTPETIGAALAALQPPDAIAVLEAPTSSQAYPRLAAAVPRHSMLRATGTALGQGMTNAVGAAVACPDRPVIAFVGDGSAMYTVQALWTQARESLDVTTVVSANRGYRILRGRSSAAAQQRPGAHVQALTQLQRPELDWVAMGRAMGVPGVAVETAEALVDALRVAFTEPGPHLIEMKMAD